ncbi:MAG: hypothetical protein KGH54_00745 [Candidatus Micrarchaeota archaeon]|nr:hypothetical protein [Candidatus Micrarchaeota archaeon]
MEGLRRSLRHETELKLLRHPSERQLESELTTKKEEQRKATSEFEINDYAYFVKHLSEVSLDSTPKVPSSNVMLGIMRMESPRDEEHRRSSSAAQTTIHYNGDITVGMDTEQSYVQFGNGSAEYGALTGRYLINKLHQIEISETLKQFQLAVVIVAYARKGSPEIVREPIFFLKKDVRA